MFNFNRTDAKAADKPATKPAPYPYAPAPPTLTNAVQSKPQATPASNLRNPALPAASPPVAPPAIVVLATREKQHSRATR